MHLVIIGGGPAGIAAALEGARLSAEVTLIEADHTGGRATWHSLLPSKAWLSAAERLTERSHAQAMGLQPGGSDNDFAAMVEHIGSLKQAMGAHYDAALSAAGVKVIAGSGSFVDAHTVRVEADGGEQTIVADAVIIASGSGPFFPPDVKPDGGRIIAPRLMSKQTKAPASMIVVGGGVTGVEFAHMYTALGTQVTLVTDLPDILPNTDSDIRNALLDQLKARGMALRTNSPVQAAAADDSGVTITLQNGETLRAEMAFLAIGRRPFVNGLGLEAAGLTLQNHGIPVNEFCETAVPGIFAAGDVTGAPMTANKGMAQGWIAARRAVGAETAPYNPHTVVEAVYTSPELAQVGLTEAAAAGSARVIRRPFASNLKANLAGEPDGLLKLVVEARSGKLLGGAAVGPHAVEVITPLAVALQQGATAGDLAAIFPGHPTVGEVLFDAARDV